MWLEKNMGHWWRVGMPQMTNHFHEVRRMSTATKNNLGDLLVQSLTEVRDGLRGQPGKLTMKTLEIPEPPHFTASSTHKLRSRLGLSQALFAKLLGISRKLVDAWEAGTRIPSPMACRLLDAVARHPSIFVPDPRRVA
jgi:putative transcriptional regulator